MRTVFSFEFSVFSYRLAAARGFQFSVIVFDEAEN
jgi:hypothetical protein